MKLTGPAFRFFEIQCHCSRPGNLSGPFAGLGSGPRRFLMPTIAISGPANAFARNPRSTDPITDPKVLARFHGLVSKQACADTFDEAPLKDFGIKGGRLRFVLDEASQRLRITTTFQVPRQFTEVET